MDGGEGMNYFLQEMEKENQQKQRNEIYAYNETSKQFGVALTKEEILEVCLYENEVLKENKRFSFDGGIIKKIMESFCDSAYLYQDNYKEMICELVRIFYLYKNESMDLLPDGELIEFMKNAFETTCQGDLDYLEGTVLDAYVRSYKEHGGF